MKSSSFGKLRTVDISLLFFFRDSRNASRKKKDRIIRLAASYLRMAATYLVLVLV